MQLFGESLFFYEKNPTTKQPKPNTLDLFLFICLQGYDCETLLINFY